MSAVGQATPFSAASEYNAIQFQIAQALGEVQTASIVKVQAVNTGAQTVDVVVLTNLMSGNRTSIPHGTIYARPYFRLQGGVSAIIVDPVVGDIGIMVFGSRDLTPVIAAKAPANPGSQRMFDWADGLYLGGILNGAPTQFVQMGSGGITIESPTEVTIQSPDNQFNGPTTFNDAVVMETTLDVLGLATFAALTATSVTTAALTVTSGGSVSFPAGSISDASLADSGVTAGSYTNANITVTAAGIITAASNGSGGGGSLSITDGSTTVTGVTSIDFAGAVVSGTTPNGVVTISAGAGTVTSVGLHNTDGDLTVSGTNPVTSAGTIEINLSTTFASSFAAVAALAASALQSISIATGAGLTGGPLGASGSTVALNSTSIADLALAASAVQPGAIQFVESAGWNSTSGAVAVGNTVAQDIVIPYACTLKEVYILTQGGAGSCTVDVWKTPIGSFPPTSGNDITGGVPPAISTSATPYTNSVLSGWATSFAQNDVIRLTLAANAVFTSVKIILRMG